MAKKARTGKKAGKNELPGLVEAMAKLVERLEGLERKTDQVLGRVANLPNEMRRAVQDLPRPQNTPRPESSSSPNQAPRERILYQAVCADCQKRCEVPFRPSGDRPVYCPECWAIRKAGHVPKDLTSNVVVPQHLKILKPVPGAEGQPASKGKSKPAKRGKKSAAKSPAKKKKR